MGIETAENPSKTMLQPACGQVEVNPYSQLRPPIGWLHLKTHAITPDHQQAWITEGFPDFSLPLATFNNGVFQREL